MYLIFGIIFIHFEDDGSTYSFYEMFVGAAIGYSYGTMSEGSYFNDKMYV